MSGSDLALLLQIVFFFLLFGMLYNFFSVAGHDVLDKKTTVK